MTRLSGGRIQEMNRKRVILRLGNLFAGLVLYGLGIAMMVSAQLGVDPWDVLHQGVSGRTGLALGSVVIVTSVFVLLAWIPLRQRPGFGTLANAIVVGLAANAALAVLPDFEEVALRFAVLTGGIVVTGMATGLYIGARFGPGPRDGLMTGLAAKGLPLAPVRTAIEVAVLAVGWAMGGQVGIGTLAYALSIGPLAKFFIDVFTVVDRSGEVLAVPDPLSTRTSGVCP